MNDTQRVMHLVDTLGAPPMPKVHWKEFLESIISECESRLEAVEEDLRDGD
jgi:hypothetical protein